MYYHNVSQIETNAIIGKFWNETIYTKVPFHFMIITQLPVLTKLNVLWITNLFYKTQYSWRKNGTERKMCINFILISTHRLYVVTKVTTILILYDLTLETTCITCYYFFVNKSFNQSINSKFITIVCIYGSLFGSTYKNAGLPNAQQNITTSCLVGLN